MLNGQWTPLLRTATRRALSAVTTGLLAAACTPDQATSPAALGSAPSRESTAKSAGVQAIELFPLVQNSPGTVRGTATAINEAGVVAGLREVLLPDEDVFPDSSNLYLWHDGQFTFYPVRLQPISINKRLEIAGNTLLMPAPGGIPLYDFPTNRAVLWKNGVVTDLGTLGGESSVATDMNEKGQIVGWSHLAGSAVTRAFIWEEGVMTDLGTLGGSSAMAWGLNNHGQVVGTSARGDGSTRAFLWEKGAMTDLGVLDGGVSSSAAAINDHGDVVGLSSTSDLGCSPIPYIWHRGAMTAISLPGKSCVSGQFTVRDISDAGHVIGGFTKFEDDPLGPPVFWRPWIWRDGVALDLPGAPGDAGVFRVNSSGETVGYAVFINTFGPAVLWSVGRKGP
jgi:probable HAF family extracellular repeat protein